VHRLESDVIPLGDRSERTDRCAAVRQGESPLQTRNTRLVTEQSLWQPFVVPPMRLLDTRTAEGRARVTLPSPLQGDACRRTAN